MDSPKRQLRLFQVAYFLFIILLVVVKPIGTVETHASNPVQWLIIAAAIWCAASGFTLQRRFNRKSTQLQGVHTKSTPQGRWRAVHIMRLTSAMGVGLWAMVLHYSGGAEWLVDLLLGSSLLLLLMWKPGVPPSLAQD